MRLSCPSIIGRDNELAALSAALDDVQRRSGALWCVVGDAGIGKSRLARELIGVAEARGLVVLVGTAVQGAVAPFRPLTEALLAACPDGPPDAPSLRRFGAALAQVVPVWALDERFEASPVVVAEAVRRLLLELGAAAGALLIVEDLHGADPDTTAVLRYLADHLHGAPVGVVVTARPGDWHGSGALVESADRRGRALRLAPLDRGEVGHMVSACLGVTEAPDALLDAVHDGAEGSPFLTEELLTAWQRAGALSVDDGGVRVSAPLPLTVPRAFGDDVRRRIAALPEHAGHIVLAAALTNLAVDSAVLASAVGRPASQVRSALQAAEGLGLLVQRPGGRLRCAHALTREAILAAGSSVARSDLAGRLLAVVTSRPPSAPEIGPEQIAELAELAGDAHAACRWRVEAGRAARTRNALETARAQLERARALAPSADDRAATEETLADILLDHGDAEAAAAVVEGLLASLRETTADHGRCGAAHLLGARAAIATGRWPVAADYLTAAQLHAEASGVSPLAGRILTLRATSALVTGAPEQAWRLARLAVDEADAVGDARTACEALEISGRAVRATDTADARVAFDEMLSRAELLGLDYWITRGLYQLGTLDLLDRFDMGRLRRALTRAERVGALATAAEMQMEIAAALEGQFRHAEALAANRDCLDTAAALGLRPLVAKAWIFQGIVHAKSGAANEVERACRAALAAADDDPEVVAGVWGDCRGMLDLAQDRRERAVAQMDRARETYGDTPAVIPRPSTALRYLVGVVAGEPDPPRPVEWGSTARLCIARGYLQFAEAARCGRRGDPVGALSAIEAAERTMRPAPWHRHLAYRLLAEAALRDGWTDPTPWLVAAVGFFDRSGNDPLATACRSLLRRTGARVARPGPAAIVPDQLRAVGVTRRELDVLRLLTDGATNAEIAHRLVLSRRTVEHHVASLLRKLGCDNRSQLVVAAHRVQVAT